MASGTSVSGSRGDRRVVAVFGPTSSGKTALALALARRLRRAGEDPVAISADALQLYRGVETLTGAADALAAASELETRLVSVLDLDDACSAGRFAQMAHAEVDAALAAGRSPIVVGGTGLYLRAALADLDLRPPVPERHRASARAELARDGAPGLHARLAASAPDLVTAVAPQDAQRLVRLRELQLAGEPPGPATGQLWSAATRHPTVLAGLRVRREVLRARIAERVAAMVRDGAPAEVRAAEAAGASEAVRRAVGYRELLAGDEAAAVAATRRFAKRQDTWMRKLPADVLLDVDGRSPDELARVVLARRPAPRS